MSDRQIPIERVPQPVLELCRRIERGGFRAWIVGGCLRDLLRGAPASDWDVATSARPKDVQKIFSHVIPTGIAHGTVTVVLHGANYEVTTLRGEAGYSDGRRPDQVYFVDDIEADLARRDFTVNAMALDPVGGHLVDPFGGLTDLDAGILRAVGDAKTRFDEDGLRVLRAARFVATLSLRLDPDTEAGIRPSLETFRKVSPERVRDEWLKAMKAARPSEAFRVMERTGILEITCPELGKQVGCAQNKWHAYDVWNHSLECLDASRGDPVFRLAALLHDYGKPQTRAFSEKTSDYTFYEHDRVGAELVAEWLRAYRFSNEERDRVIHLVRHHLVCYSEDWTDAAVRRFIKRVGREHLGDLIQLAEADALGKGRPVDREIEALKQLTARCKRALDAKQPTTTRDLAIGGRDVIEKLQCRPGPIVGKVLDALLEKVLEEPALNDRDALLALVGDLAKECAA